MKVEEQSDKSKPAIHFLPSSCWCLRKGGSYLELWVRLT